MYNLLMLCFWFPTYTVSELKSLSARQIPLSHLPFFYYVDQAQIVNNIQSLASIFFAGIRACCLDCPHQHYRFLVEAFTPVSNK